MEVWQLTPWTEVDAMLRLLIAAIVGGAIGYEREHAGKAAGLRTLVMVCIGAALFTIASIYGFGEPADPSRIAAGVVVGVGFLGAGTILHGEGGIVAGLTTAATIWLTASLGMGVGAGYYALVLAAAVVVMVVLLLFPRVEEAIDNIHEVRVYEVTCAMRPELVTLPSFSTEEAQGSMKTSVLIFAGVMPGPRQNEAVSLSKRLTLTIQSSFSMAMRTLLALAPEQAGFWPQAKKPLIFSLAIWSKSMSQEAFWVFLYQLLPAAIQSPATEER